MPSQFPGVPSYLSFKPPARRSEATTGEGRRQQQVSRTEEKAKSFLNEDCLNDFDQLTLASVDIPSSWNIISFKNEEKILFEEVVFDEDGRPQFKFSLTVFRSLRFQLVVAECVLSPSKVSHICKKKQLERKSDVRNILAFLRCQDGATKEDRASQCLQTLNALIENEVEDSSSFLKLSFIKGQLEILLSGRSKYPASFIWTALTWMRTSPALYRMLLQSGCLSLPSIGYLKQISGSFAVESGLSSTVRSYLRTRIDHLSPEQRTVSLLIDEVSLAQKSSAAFLSCVIIAFKIPHKEKALLRPISFAVGKFSKCNIEIFITQSKIVRFKPFKKLCNIEFCRNSNINEEDHKRQIIES